MATLSRQTLDEDGSEITFGAAAAGGDEVTNLDGKTQLIIKNDDTGSHTVTIAQQVGGTVTNASLGELSKNDVALTVAAGEIGVIPPLPKGAFNDINGNLQISYDAVTSLSIVAVFEQ